MIQALRRQRYFTDRRRRVLVVREPHQNQRPQHRHEFFEIAVILSGTGTHVTGQSRHLLKPGDVLVINTRRAHGYKNTRDLNLINLLIHPDLLLRLARELGDLPGFHTLFVTRPMENSVAFRGGLHLSPAELAKVEDWVGCLETETHQRQEGGDLLAEAYLTLIVGLLSRKYGRLSSFRSQPEGGIGRLLSWLEKNLGQPIQVADMAREAGMSSRNFYRFFRGVMGMTPTAYLQKIRIQRAVGELSSGESRIGEIAQQCGFEDSNYFSRIFRQVTKSSPRAYRQKHGRKVCVNPTAHP